MNAAVIQKTLSDRFASQPEIAAVYLFGSVARGTQHSRSDVDLGILYEETPPRTLSGRPFGLEADLTELVGLPVQIVVLNDAPVDLIHRVLRDGILIQENNPGRRIAFEVRARNEYWDLKPVLDRYRGAE